MSHDDLISFLKRSQAALRPSVTIPTAAVAEQGEDSGMSTDEHLSSGSDSATTTKSESYIFVKENCCPDAAWGKGTEFLDPADSSLTR